MIRVCSVDDVPAGEGRAVTVAGRRVAVFRADEGWFAVDAACPHLGGPLADGIVARRTVICPLHERRFDLATGRELTGGHCVAVHRVEVRGTDVYLEEPISIASSVTWPTRSASWASRARPAS